MNILYKLISKILARRLSNVLHQVISESQHAFVNGRQIFKTFMSTNEMVDELVFNIRPWVLCKLNMEKTFDHVCWKFVDCMQVWFQAEMEKMDQNVYFHNQFCSYNEWWALFFFPCF